MRLYGKLGKQHDHDTYNFDCKLQVGTRHIHSANLQLEVGTVSVNQMSMLLAHFLTSGCQNVRNIGLSMVNRQVWRRRCRQLHMTLSYQWCYIGKTVSYEAACIFFDSINSGTNSAML